VQTLHNSSEYSLDIRYLWEIVRNLTKRNAVYEDINLHEIATKQIEESAFAHVSKFYRDLIEIQHELAIKHNIRLFDPNANTKIEIYKELSDKLEVYLLINETIEENIIFNMWKIWMS